MKAREADATNPNLNIYHSIESLKDNRLVEHVYDEIKQRPPPSKDPGLLNFIIFHCVGFDN